MMAQTEVKMVKNRGPWKDSLRKMRLRNLMATGFVFALLPGLGGAEPIRDADSDINIRKVAYGHLSARVLHVACYYKLFDTLQESSKRAEEMVAGTPLKADTVKRMMRVLANHGIVMMDESERFSLNDQSQLLVSTAPNSLQSALAKEFDLKRWQAIGNIHLALSSEKEPFADLFGESYYTYLEKDQIASELFNKGMKNFSEQEDEQVARLDIFKNFKVYCDIGGGTGGLISRVQRQHPGVQVILFDLPEAINLCAYSNVTKVSGSFFEKVPQAEIYTVKRVLHNWRDHECITILTNIKAALLDQWKGRILVIEKVLPQKLDGSMLVDSDIVGMALGGRERALGEFIELGHKAGLDLEDQIVLPSGVSVLVFQPKL